MEIFYYVSLTSAKAFLSTKRATSRVHEIGKVSPSCWCLIHRNLHYFCHSGKDTIKHHTIKTVLFAYMAWDQLRNVLGLAISPDSWAISEKKKTRTDQQHYSKPILVSEPDFSQNPGMFTQYISVAFWKRQDLSSIGLTSIFAEQETVISRDTQFCYSNILMKVEVSCWSMLLLKTQMANTDMPERHFYFCSCLQSQDNTGMFPWCSISSKKAFPV